MTCPPSLGRGFDGGGPERFTERHGPRTGMDTGRTQRRAATRPNRPAATGRPPGEEETPLVEAVVAPSRFERRGLFFGPVRKLPPGDAIPAPRGVSSARPPFPRIVPRVAFPRTAV